MIRAVIDSNIIALGFISSPQSRAGTIHDAWIEGQYRLVTSQFCIRELKRVLGKRYFQSQLTPEMTDAYVRSVRQGSDYVRLTTRVFGVADHWQDDLMVSTALSGRANYLVIRDTGLLAVGYYSASPAESVQVINEEQFCLLLERS